jgi:hypothetical protein
MVKCPKQCIFINSLGYCSIPETNNKFCDSGQRIKAKEHKEV